MITLTREEAQQVLDALEAEHSAIYGTSQTARAIETLRARLAAPVKPAGEWVGDKEYWEYPERCKHGVWSADHCYQCEKEQDPVAWCIVENGRTHGLVKSKPAVMNAEKWQPLYTAPPQREWVGLTDEEVAKCWTDGFNACEQQTVADLRNFIARAIEQKLKEKNSV